MVRTAELIRLSIEKSRLKILSENELATLLGGGKVLNELNIGTKHLIFARNKLSRGVEGAEHVGAMTEALFFLRLLAGHVYEGHAFFKQVVRLDELPARGTSRMLDDSFYASVHYLHKYFGKRNVVKDLRQKFAFHANKAMLLHTFEEVSEGYSYDLALGLKNKGDNIFYGSETLMIDGVRHLDPPEPDWEKAIQATFKGTLDAGFHLQIAFQRAVGHVLIDRIGIDMEEATRDRVPDGPRLQDVIVPYFCEEPPVKGQSPNA